MTDAAVAPLASLHEFIGFLFADVADGFVEVRCPRQTPGRPILGTRYFAAADLDGIAGAVLDYDERADALPCIGIGVRGTQSGSAADVTALPALWADLDWKTYAGGREEARDALLRFPLPPHIIVRSGHGYHAYWRLREPWTLETAHERHEGGRLLRRLAQYLGADLNTATLQCILRAPGTLNRKDLQAPVRTAITVWRPEIAPYNPGDFDEALPPERHPDLGDISETQADLLRRWREAAPDAIVVDTLRVPKLTLTTIIHGAPNGADESSTAQSVITSLLRASYDADAVRAVFAATPEGIGHGWHKRDRDGDRWLALSVTRAQQWLAAQGVPAAPAQPPPDEVAAEAAQRWAPEPVVSALGRDVPAPPMLIEGLLRQADLSAIVADAGVGKSFLADWIGFHLAGGLPLWGRATTRQRVLVIQEEMSDAESIERLRRIRLALPLTDQEVAGVVFDHVWQPGLQLDKPDALHRVLERNMYDLVVVDSFAAVKGGIDENDNDAISRLLNGVKRTICHPYRCHMLFIHHTRKRPPGASFDPSEAARGASAFKACLDTMWVLDRPTGAAWTKLHLVKTRGWRAKTKPMMIQLVDDNEAIRFVLSQSDKPEEGDPRPMVQQVEDHVTNLMGVQSPMPMAAVIPILAVEFKISIETAEHLLRQATRRRHCTWQIEGRQIMTRPLALVPED